MKSRAVAHEMLAGSSGELLALSVVTFMLVPHYRLIEDA
ncbi:hypothetical protein Q31b_58320 [Novipirellula aureliae]|uniref:Uncharacterized protein n=1 Tax=Novipirellula aureliae TaxID=2527966 RepID=A0A5C6D9H3_9BACT|nr:hypothetical protein Q31b_58320 [Novipirellula aureliae]